MNGLVHTVTECEYGEGETQLLGHWNDWASPLYFQSDRRQRPECRSEAVESYLTQSFIRLQSPVVFGSAVSAHGKK
jgi:hypothetical protein